MTINSALLMMISSLIFLLIGGGEVAGWLSSSPTTTKLWRKSPFQSPPRICGPAPFRSPFLILDTTTMPTTRLFMSGYGVAVNYTWSEEPFEMEVTIPVPSDTRAKDVFFCAKPRSIELRLVQDKNNNASSSNLLLLDPNRTLRGKLSPEGTYWALSEDRQSITVTMEKNIPPHDDFDVVEYDWKGVYVGDDAEVVERRYDEPEELDVREYAASLGVDIDNINMSMVDKTMFSSGLNLTKSTLDQLTKAGYVQEVTRQGDGKEYRVNEEGEAVPFKSLGETIGEDEVKAARTGSSKIPFLDTSSPWHNYEMVAEELQMNNNNNVTKSDNATAAAERDVRRNVAAKRKNDVLPNKEADPIDKLTVQRLKEILREQGLKVSGNKQELRDRLRGHVQTMMQSDNGAMVEEQK